MTALPAASAADHHEALLEQAGRIARDMADVLTLLQGHASLARATCPEAVEAHAHVEEITRLAMRAAALAQQLAGLAHVSARAPERGGAPAHTPASGQGTVLVAEDEPMVAELTRRILTGAGYDVRVAHDGQAALDALRMDRDAFVLVVSDIVMPRMSGLELARRLIEELPTLPVLLVSGYPEDERRLSDTTLARTPFLAKPFKTADLITAVRTLIAQGLQTEPATP